MEKEETHASYMKLRQRNLLLGSRRGAEEPEPMS